MKYFAKSTFAAALLIAAFVTCAQAADGKTRVLLTFGGHGFEQEPFFAMFDGMKDIEYTKAPMPESADLLKPGLEKDYDVIVMYDMVGGITPEQQKAFVALLNKGIGLVSLHHNMGAHRNWDEFRKITGGKFIFEPAEIEGQQYPKSGWAHGQDMKVTVTDAELESFIAEINHIYPVLKLTLDDVCRWDAGLVPFGENAPGAKDLSYGKRSRLIDHGAEDGLEGLISLIGIRYTMGRGEAARAVDLVARKLGRNPPPIPVGSVPVHGGDLTDFEGFVAEAARRHAGLMDVDTVRALAQNHGTGLDAVAALAGERPEWAAPIPGSRVLGAEVVHAARSEMAVRLADVVLRRTDLGPGADPGDAAIRACARLMAPERGWDEATTEAEVADVRADLAAHRPRGPVAAG